MNLIDLLEKMAREGGANLYLAAGALPVFDPGGRMSFIGAERLTPAQVEELANSIMDEEDRRSFEQKPELNLGYGLPGIGRFRVNVYRQRGTVAVAIRRINYEIPNLAAINLPEAVRKLALESLGLVLVTGPTGCGKSTTLAAMIDLINETERKHILTVEDPIEFLHPHKQSIVSQREIGVDTDSYADALQSALRQALDVLFIGEIRTGEAMSAALNFSETGHLVLSTLHANNANQALERIISFFPSEAHPMILQQLSLNLKGMISQRLIPRADGKGRVAVVEVLLSTARIRNLIKKGDIEAVKSAIAVGRHEGMQTFDQALYDLYTEGVITLDTAFRSADNPTDLRLLIEIESADFKRSGLSLVDDERIEEYAVGVSTESPAGGDGREEQISSSKGWIQGRSFDRLRRGDEH